jgi:5'(3')-deoxyribonucleotidase
MAAKPVLAVDVDEVLAFFIPTLADFHNEVFAADVPHPLTADSFSSYDFCKIWGGTMEDSYVKMDAFFESAHFKEKIKPVPFAFEMLQQLREDFELHIVTSRQHKIEESTLHWINTYYPDIFTKVHFGNHYTRDGKSRSKPDMCREIGAVLLIDDSLVYAAQCQKASVPVILFGQYAWNQVDEAVSVLDDGVTVKEFKAEFAGACMPKTIYRVTQWQEMRAALTFVLAV